MPRARHAHIPTPSWRPFVPSGRPPSPESSISSDDTSDRAYHILHAPAAARERACWAPPPDAKSARAPLFPTHAEAAAALSAAHATCTASAAAAAPAATTTTARPTAAVVPPASHPLRPARPALPTPHASPARAAALRAAAASVVALEAALTRHTTALRSALAALHAARPPPLPDRALDLTQEAVAAAAATQAHFASRTSTLRTALQDAAAAARAPPPLSPTSPTPPASPLLRTRTPHAATRRLLASSSPSFAHRYRAFIDPKKYPLLARTFTLRDGYRLHGAPSDYNLLTQPENPCDAAAMGYTPPLPPTPQSSLVAAVQNGHADAALDVDALDLTDRDHPESHRSASWTSRDPDSPLQSFSFSHRGPLSVPPREPPVNLRYSAEHPTARSADRRSLLFRTPGAKRRREWVHAEPGSYRLDDCRAESVRSGGSESSDYITPPLSRRRQAPITSRRNAMSAPCHFRGGVVDLDDSDFMFAEESRSPDSAPDVVDIDGEI